MYEMLHVNLKKSLTCNIMLLPPTLFIFKKYNNSSFINILEVHWTLANQPPKKCTLKSILPGEIGQINY